MNINISAEPKVLGFLLYSFLHNCEQDAAKGMTEAELNSALSKMLASLGDRYTRYLPPAKYATIVQVCLKRKVPSRCVLKVATYNVRCSSFVWFGLRIHKCVRLAFANKSVGCRYPQAHE